MNKLVVALFLTIIITAASFAVHVGGYIRSNGTYVAPYERSTPNDTVKDNFDYKGNTNPYTGEEGQNRYIHNPSSDYFQGFSNKPKKQSYLVSAEVKGIHNLSGTFVQPHLKTKKELNEIDSYLINNSVNPYLNKKNYRSPLKTKRKMK